MPRKDNVRAMRKVLRDAMDYQREVGPDTPFHRLAEREQLEVLDRVAAHNLNGIIGNYRRDRIPVAKENAYEAIVQLSKMLLLLEKEEQYGEN